jgi:hypothetical protein
LDGILGLPRLSRNEPVQKKLIIEELTAQLKEQAAQIQKVSAQLEMSKSALQTVKNND